MTDRKLTIAQLMEGGLALLLSKPIAFALFVPVDIIIAYGAMWAEARYGLNLWLAAGLSIVPHALASAVLLLALGEKLIEVLRDPAELFVRLAFILATTLIVVLGSAAAAVFFIIPGLYVAARWTLVSPLVLLDGAGIKHSLSRSWELTERSAWALVAVIVIVSVPPFVLGLFSGGWIYEGFPPSPAIALELAAGAALTAFEVAVWVFAFRALSPEPDRLAEVFA